MKKKIADLYFSIAVVRALEIMAYSLSDFKTGGNTKKLKGGHIVSGRASAEPRSTALPPGPESPPSAMVFKARMDPHKALDN